jgi:hypothetical protein
MAQQYEPAIWDKPILTQSAGQQVTHDLAKPWCNTTGAFPGYSQKIGTFEILLKVRTSTFPCFHNVKHK